MNIFRALWYLGASDTTRKTLGTLWSTYKCPRQVGLWASFIDALATASARLTLDYGVISQFSEGVQMSLNLPLALWMHQARRQWRQHALAEAAHRLGHTYPQQVEHVDWDVCIGPRGKRHPMLDTIQAHALNTKDRLHRHYNASCGVECEHLCGEPDHIQHRLLRRAAARPLCEQVGLSADKIAYLAR